MVGMGFELWKARGLLVQIGSRGPGFRNARVQSGYPR